MKLFFTTLLAFVTLATTAQTNISGRVTDDKGAAIVSANIVILDTYDGASTDADGKFSFSTTEMGDKLLQVSAIGYESFQQPLTLDGKSQTLNIKMPELINQLEGVTISAGSFTAGDEKRRTILKPLDIATTAGATADIAGALNTLPGTQKVGESGRLFVRGGDDNEARVFIDGLAVLNAYGTAAPNTPSRGRFLPWMFKGTSFSTGGYSAEYGQALSSALVLNSKDNVELTQTDIGILSVGADVAHTQAWDKGSMTGKIQYTNIRPYFGAINQRVDWKLAPASLEGSTVFRHNIGKNGIIKFFGNFNHSNFSLYNHDILNPSQKQLYELSNNYAYGNLAYKTILNDKWNIRGGLSYTLNENNSKLDGSPLDDSEKGIHGKLVAEHSLSDRIELHVGTEVIARDYQASKQDPETLQILRQDFKEAISATFVEAEAFASNHFVTRVGGRYEYNSLTGKSSVDPRVSMAYKPGKQGQLAFAYGKFRQSPKNMYVRVNNDLHSEKADHYILSYQIVNDHRTFRVETYYKDYRSLVKFGDADGNILNNNGKGYAKGAEVFWRDNKSLKNVDYWLSYSYLDTKRNYLNYPASATPYFASKHNFSVVYKHFFNKLKSQLGVTYSYGSGRPYNDPNDLKFNSKLTRSYQDLSANISYLPKNFLIIYLSCSNLLGYNNVFGYQYSTTPNEQGVFPGKAITQPAKRFLFLGVFITISKNKSVNQLPNL